MNELPVGIQTFREIREEGYCYVDKTSLVARMADEGKYYFLSGPRRFSKSLPVSTLAAAFAGQRELFAELHLDDRWNWSRRSPRLAPPQRHRRLRRLLGRALEQIQARRTTTRSTPASPSP